LESLQEIGFVHRDFTMKNILLDMIDDDYFYINGILFMTKYRIKIIDFDFSTIIGHKTSDGKEITIGNLLYYKWPYFLSLDHDGYRYENKLSYDLFLLFTDICIQINQHNKLEQCQIILEFMDQYGIVFMDRKNMWHYLFNIGNIDIYNKIPIYNLSKETVLLKDEIQQSDFISNMLEFIPKKFKNIYYSNFKEYISKDDDEDEQLDDFKSNNKRYQIKYSLKNL